MPGKATLGGTKAPCDDAQMMVCVCVSVCECMRMYVTCFQAMQAGKAGWACVSACGGLWGYSGGL